MRKIHTKKSISFLMLVFSLVAFHCAPLPENLFARDESKVLFDRDGELLAATIAGDQQWRFPASGDLPDKYITALLAFEDKRFYSHPGVDPVAIARAIKSNLVAGRVVSGGSTLTMQLARMLRGDPPRNLSSKIIEAGMAFKLEWHFDKTELLHYYASFAPFGGNNVGIDAASWRYYQRPPGQLSWAEAALLAVLPNAPSMMHLGAARDKLQAKRNRLLAKLHRQQQLSDSDYRLALQEPLPAAPKPLPKLTPHLLQTLAQQISADISANNIEEKAAGSSWQTSLSIQWQRAALEVAKHQGRRLASEGINNLAMVVIDNRDMSLLAYVGNYTHSNVAADVDIASKPRSTGSILKPLLYAAALDAGQLMPQTLIADVPSNYDGFSPENYDRKYRGAVPAQQALVQSLNIPSVRMLKDYGVDRFYQDLQQLGMSTLFRPASGYGLSLILGGAEGRLDELTRIYARLMKQARSGDEKSFPLSQGGSWLTLQALQQVKRPGQNDQWREFSSGHDSLLDSADSGREIAWKTGTSYGLRDAWAIGSSSRYTVGVWAGNAGGEGVAGLSGLNSAAPAMLEMFERLGRNQWLPRPEYALKQLRLCQQDGYLAGDSGCEAIDSWVPRHSHFQKMTPHIRQIYLDNSGQYRVHGDCESVAKMQRHSWLVLPPLQEYYWRQHNASYRRLPPWRDDCVAGLARIDSDNPMAIVYPTEGARVFIPRQLDGQRSKLVFKATHRNAGEQLYWHLDDQYLGDTKLYHQQALYVEPGWHKLTLIDQLGYRIERWFKVVGESDPKL